MVSIRTSWKKSFSGTVGKGKRGIGRRLAASDRITPVKAIRAKTIRRVRASMVIGALS
jgi:hypothetical protein